MWSTTIKSQVKLHFLDQKWQDKKKNYAAFKRKEPKTQQEMLMESLKKQAEDIRKRQETDDLYNKLKTGGTLTEEEKAYLREHNPKALEAYERAQSEKKAYEKQLKNCKTKEEVERVKVNRVNGMLAKMKSVMNNPCIPKGEKVAIAWQINNELCLMEKTEQEFKKSAKYHSLESEQEENVEAAKENAKENERVQEQMIESAEDDFVDDSSDDKIPALVGEKAFDSEPSEKSDITIKKKEPGKKRKIEMPQVSFKDVEKEIHKCVREYGDSQSKFLIEV